LNKTLKLLCSLPPRHAESLKHSSVRADQDRLRARTNHGHGVRRVPSGLREISMNFRHRDARRQFTRSETRIPTISAPTSFRNSRCTRPASARTAANCGGLLLLRFSASEEIDLFRESQQTSARSDTDRGRCRPPPARSFHRASGLQIQRPRQSVRHHVDSSATNRLPCAIAEATSSRQ